MRCPRLMPAFLLCVVASAILICYYICNVHTQSNGKWLRYSRVAKERGSTRLVQDWKADKAAALNHSLRVTPHQSATRSEMRKHEEPFSDSALLSEAYRRSPCSSLEHEFVGSNPLFAPCLPSVPTGVATWGKYPYVGSFNFTPHSKNPCFHTTLTTTTKNGTTKRKENTTPENRVLRCVPYFFLAGFSKCGSTDIYLRLTAHPQIWHGGKEIMYFPRRRFPEYYGEKMSFAKYLKKFGKVDAAVIEDLASKGYSRQVIGDYTVGTVNEVFEWPQLSGNEGCHEPRVINAQHIRYLNPDIKVIFIMRYPVQRLFSRFFFDYNRSMLMDTRELTPVNVSARNPEGFHRFVVEGLKLYQSCFQTHSLRHCVYNRTLWESVHGLKIQDCLYAVLLEDWLRVIPRDQLLFIRSEDFKANVREVLMRIFTFLDLDPISDEQMDKIVSMEYSNVNEKPHGAMLPETRTLLEQFFRPFNRRLAQILDDPKFLWEDV